MEKLLSVDEISDILGVSKATVYRWVHYGFVRYLKVGGAVRFKVVAGHCPKCGAPAPDNFCGECGLHF